MARDGDEGLEGRYTDAFRVGISLYKVEFEFGQFDLNQKTTHFHTRVITGPDHAKIFFETFAKSMQEYESNFGPINQNVE